MRNVIELLLSVAEFAPHKEPLPPEPSVIQSAYCYQQIRYMVELAESMLPLIENGSFFATQVVARGIMESVFKFASASVSEVICLRLVYTDAWEEVDKTQKYLDCEPNADPIIQTLITACENERDFIAGLHPCLLYTSPSPRD